VTTVVAVVVWTDKALADRVVLNLTMTPFTSAEASGVLDCAGRVRSALVAESEPVQQRRASTIRAGCSRRVDRSGRIWRGMVGRS
jgi:hypothetical protein